MTNAKCMKSLKPEVREAQWWPKLGVPPPQNVSARESEKDHGKQVLTTRKPLLYLTFSYSHKNATFNFSVAMGKQDSKDNEKPQ